MKPTAADHARLLEAAYDLARQLAALGAVKVILFGSLARGEVSMFSDIDLLALFDEETPARTLTRRAYAHIHTSEAVDLIAYGLTAFKRVQNRPFFRALLNEGKVLYEKPETGS